MQQTQVPLLGFAAASGTGKTTLLEQIIPLIKAQGLRVGLIKKSHHNIQDTLLIFHRNNLPILPAKVDSFVVVQIDYSSILEDNFLKLK